MICSCCGFEIKGTSYSVQRGQRIVCEKCWNNPEMFFPEKIEKDQRLKMLSKMAQTKDNDSDIVEVKAIRLVQKNIEMYIGKMKVNDILTLYELDKFKEEELEGYQRERYEERTTQLVDYLEKSPLAVMPAILVGLRKTNFVDLNDDIGKLIIERKKGSLWIIDGQHRVGGFSKIYDRFIFTKSLGVSLFSNLMDYELPVVFIDSSGAAEKIKSSLTKNDNQLTAEDIEKAIFFIVNKTQRGISPSLRDALLYSIKTSGIDGLSIVDKEGWRIMGAQIGIALNCKDNCPLHAKINISGQRNSGKPLQLNSFVSSLESLFKDKEFQTLNIEEKIGFLDAFWQALGDLSPDALGDERRPRLKDEEFGRRFASNIGKAKPDNRKRKPNEPKSMLLSALGVYAVHRIARDLLHVATKEKVDYRDKVFFIERMSALNKFDWNAKTSPLAALGGMKGVTKAYDLISKVIGNGELLASSERPLQKFARAEHS